jgi:hypothetical protein
MRGLIFAALLAFSPADYAVCTRHDNGPIVKQTPEPQFVRKPDLAALTAYPKTMVFDGMPPTRFRAPRKMKVETGSVAKCGTPAKGFVFEGCTDGVVVHVPNPCDFPNESFAVLLCHEQGHLQGWPADHGA